MAPVWLGMGKKAEPDEDKVRINPEHFSEKTQRPCVTFPAFSWNWFVAGRRGRGGGKVGTSGGSGNGGLRRRAGAGECVHRRVAGSQGCIQVVRLMVEMVGDGGSRMCLSRRGPRSRALRPGATSSPRRPRRPRRPPRPPSMLSTGALANVQGHGSPLNLEATHPAHAPVSPGPHLPPSHSRA